MSNIGRAKIVSRLDRRRTWIMAVGFNAGSWIVVGIDLTAGKFWKIRRPAFIQENTVYESVLGRIEEKLGAHAIKRVAARTHLSTLWLFEPAKRPDDRADYCVDCCFYWKKNSWYEWIMLPADWLTCLWWCSCTDQTDQGRVWQFVTDL